MYFVEQSKIEIKLISEDGEVYIYEDYNDFINSTSYYFVDKHIVNTFKDYFDDWVWLYAHNKERKRYIVRDKFGSIFTKTELLNDIRELNKKKYRFLHRLPKQLYIFRYDPVPHIGKMRGHSGCWYKTPHTTQEKRWNIAHFEYVRGKRHPSYLADVWDDYVRSDVRTRKSWKKNKKKTQWM